MFVYTGVCMRALFQKKRVEMGEKRVGLLVKMCAFLFQIRIEKINPRSRTGTGL
jgi:hypothetical protein